MLRQYGIAMRQTLIAVSFAALALSACVQVNETVVAGASPASDAEFRNCPGYAAAYQVTDDFMRTFNSKDAAAWGSTFHFPSVRIASGRVTILNSPADLENSFPTLIASGWDYSEWAARRVVQCDATKAHMLTTFVRYRADKSEMSRFNSLYIVELKNGRWALTARSSFAP